jgi:hypothetical protein
MPNGVHMVGTGRFVKLLKVIIGRTRLVLEVALSSGNKLLIRVIGLLVIAARIAAGSDCNLLGSSLWPPLVAFGAPLHALADCLKGHPSTAVGGRIPVALDKNGSDCLLAKGVPSIDVEYLLCGLRLIMTELMHQGSTVRVEPECRDDVGIADLGKLMTLSREPSDVIP